MGFILRKDWQREVSAPAWGLGGFQGASETREESEVAVGSVAWWDFSYYSGIAVCCGFLHAVATE